MSVTHGYFDAGGVPIYASIYMPSGLPSAGVVLCEPFGEEKRCTSRMMTRLARRLSDSGLAVLRFDFSGTGDSGGTHGNALWSDWENEAEAAARFLMSESGCSSIAFAGFRAGALLASHGALNVRETTALVLVEPVLSGEELLQELERRERLKQLPSFETDESGCVEYGGFSVSLKMREELKLRSLHEMLSRLPEEMALHLLSISGMKRFPASWKNLQERALRHGTAEIIRDKPFWGQVEYFESDIVLDAILARLTVA